MKKMMRPIKLLVCSAAMIVFCLGCQTIKYQPDSAIPDSQVVVVDDIEAHYVKSSLLDYSVGMKPIDIPIWDPDKYLVGQKTLAGFALFFGDPYTYAEAQMQISDLSRRLLRKQDILPSQQCQGLVVAKRIYKEAKDSSGRTEKVEEVIDHYELTLNFFGESFVVRFRRAVVKT